MFISKYTKVHTYNSLMISVLIDLQVTKVTSETRVLHNLRHIGHSKIQLFHLYLQKVHVWSRLEHFLKIKIHRQ